MWHLIAWLIGRVSEAIHEQDRTWQLDDADPMPSWPPR